ncbi:uncharacterized protein PAC_19474 [Phialocephala subalpina]|uniref:DUF6590 domain-containing protein n=1 Tax=Phialocephala subalpina TaxID=576137 RepID=A0A1L7XX02_9HELO|nr:uncharacterized protein PAC_19474 [Phialocephala subalpina]
MSFGFSVGDILGGASLAYQLCKALSETKGSARDYQQLIAELNVVHKVLIQVEQLRVSNQLAQATLNAVLFTTNAANEAMEVFLADHEKYRESLKEGGSGNVLKDSWRKWQWTFTMETERTKLSQTLASMLVSINCLVQLACFFNTGYNPEVDVKLSNAYERRYYEFSPPFDNVKLEACISGTEIWGERKPYFKVRHQPAQFFRSGQVFSLCISANLSVHHRSRWRHRRIEISQLPLEPIGTLKAKYEQAQKEDREARLKQILSLPLAKMVQHIKEGRNGKVVCTLCPDAAPLIGGQELNKDDWADRHFRFCHWQQYCTMRGISPNSDALPSIASYFTPNPKQLITQPTSADSLHTLSADWITLEDITSDEPIYEDWQIREMTYCSQTSEPGIPGPIMIRRFVVIQEGLESCLCLGIHTYAGLGSSDQADQNLFAILHSSKEVPTPLEKETGMVLTPIRMKPEHPSTVLPNSSRIHFGRAYGISHKMAVKPLGLIHAGSMEKLMSQSVAHACRNNPDNSAQLSESQSYGVAGGEVMDVFSGNRKMDINKDIIPADMEVAKDMRNSIMDVLGPDISLDNHPPPKEPVLSSSALSDDVMDSEPVRERKRVRVA